MASLRKQYIRLKKILKTRGLTHVKKKEGMYLTSVDHPDILINKFIARWGHRPTIFCFMSDKKEKLYVLLGPTSIDKVKQDVV